MLLKVNPVASNFLLFVLALSNLLFVNIHLNAQMEHRAISFHEYSVDFELVRKAKLLGFNTVELQTEGGTLKPLLKLRAYANENNLFSKMDSLGMKVSLWVHEFEDYKEDWGEIQIENNRLWQEIRNKYRFILNKLFPEIDHLVLTIVESEHRATDSDILKKLIETIHLETTLAQKTFMVRTFAWDPSEMKNVANILSALPKDIIIHTKYVPQDWHLRSVHHPLLGKVGNHKQVVEVDFAGEYFKLRYVANCFTKDLQNRYNHWKAMGIDGVVVRVNRLTKESDNSINGELMEVNLWVLGYWLNGKSEDTAWYDYLRKRFGEDVDTDKLKLALQKTGSIVATALCVEKETFGDTRQSIPAKLTMHPEIMFPNSNKESRYQTYYTEMASKSPPPLDNWAFAYDDKDDYMFRNPFYRNWSVWIWDNTYKDTYHRIRKGDATIIRNKEKEYKYQLNEINQSLEIIDGLHGNLSPEDYEFLKWKLAETKFMLRSMCEMQLAWLKMSHAIYVSDPSISAKMKAEAEIHIDKLIQLNEQKIESAEISVEGQFEILERGNYLDINGFIKSFKNHWQYMMR